MAKAKKIVTGILALVMALSAASCGTTAKDSGGETSSAGNDTTAANAQATPTSISQTEKLCMLSLPTTLQTL